MTLKLPNRSIAYPAGIAEDVFVQVGKFTFPADFVFIDYDVDPHVPLILGRPFLRTARALVDVYGEELILRDGDEKLIFHADNTSKHPHKHENESINMINFIDISYGDRFQEVLKIKKSNHPLSGSLTPSSDPVVESLFPSLTPFGDIDLLLEETDTFFSLNDSIPPGINNGIYDSEGDILSLEELLNDEIPRDLPPKELKDDEPSTTNFNDSEGDILFLENLLKDEPLETERSEIYTLIEEPPDTFLIGDEEIKFNPFKDIDDPVPIPRVSETPLDSFDSSLDNFDTAFTNPIFDIQNEDSDASEIETIIDEVQIDRFPMILKTAVLVLNPPISFMVISWEILNPDHIFDHFVKIPSDKSKVHIEVLSVLWGNRLPIPDGSLPLSRLKWDPHAAVAADVAIGPTCHVASLRYEVRVSGGRVAEPIIGVQAFGMLLEDIHVTWAHLEKKRRRLELYTKVVEEKSSQWLETALEILVTPSGLQSESVRNLVTASGSNRLKETL
ncbi:reverse transcriptase domain-containing protein [Tanacetum coccineum]